MPGQEQADLVVEWRPSKNAEVSLVDEGIVSVDQNIAIGWVQWTKIPCILHVEDGSLFETAGVSTDDWLVQINGKSTGKYSAKDIERLLKKAQHRHTVTPGGGIM